MLALIVSHGNVVALQTELGSLRWLASALFGYFFLTTFFISDPVLSEADTPTLPACRGDLSDTSAFQKTGVFLFFLTISPDPLTRPGHGTAAAALTAGPLAIPFQRFQKPNQETQETVPLQSYSPAIPPKPSENKH